MDESYSATRSVCSCCKTRARSAGQKWHSTFCEQAVVDAKPLRLPQNMKINPGLLAFAKK